jgi:hypothetical protein
MWLCAFSFVLCTWCSLANTLWCTLPVQLQYLTGVHCGDVTSCVYVEKWDCHSSWRSFRLAIDRRCVHWFVLSVNCGPKCSVLFVRAQLTQEKKPPVFAKSETRKNARPNITVFWRLFTICFEEAVSKFFFNVTLSGDVVQWQFFEYKWYLLWGHAVQYNTSVGHCRCNCLLAAGWGGLTSSLGCPGRLCR